MRTVLQSLAGCLAGYTAVLLVSQMGLAQPLPLPSSDPADAALTDKARELFTQGTKASETGKWEQCRASFLAAWGIKKHWQLAGNLGACEAKLGKFVDAAEHLRFFVNRLPASSTAERRARADSLYAEVRAQVGALLVEVDVPGADIWIDGASVGRAPLEEEVFVYPGAMKMQVKLEGYETLKQEVYVEAGKSEKVVVALKKPEMGKTEIGKTEEPKKVAVEPVVVERPRWPAMAMGVGGGVGMIAGVALIAVANARYADARDQIADITGPSGNSCISGASNVDSRCNDQQQLVTSVSNIRAGGITAFLVGGIGIGGALAYHFWPKSGSKRETGSTMPIVVPTIGTNVLGATWISSF